jgi:ElaB/YqjD/DUF883 family membrane-anchored ribosome-binding protein
MPAPRADELSWRLASKENNVVATARAQNGSAKLRRAAAAAVTTSAQSVREDLSSLSEDVASLAQALGTRTKTQFAALAERAKARGGNAVGAVRAQVADRPAIALGAAAGVGLIIGILLARR